MGLLIFILLGALVGWLATRVMHRPEGWLGSAVIGIVGALLGAFIAHLFNADQPLLALDFGSLLAAFIGACLLAGILNYLDTKRVRP